MICWMFPGQPLKYLPSRPDDNDYNDISRICINKAGFDLFSCSPLSSDLTSNICLQIYGVAISLYSARKLRNSGARPDVVAQHSMGIYPALVACGVCSEEDAIEMTARAGLCMSVMGKSNEYLLGCIIGLSASVLSTLLESIDAYIANFNTSKHFLLAGHKSELTSLLQAAQSAGAFSVSSFNCDAPLHTPLMKTVSTGLKSVFADYNFSTPTTPLMSHKGELLTTPEQIRCFLHDQILQPVYWEKTVSALRNLGVTKFVEVGAGDALKKFNRWIESEQVNQ